MTLNAVLAEAIAGELDDAGFTDNSPRLGTAYIDQRDGEVSTFVYRSGIYRNRVVLRSHNGRQRFHETIAIFHQHYTRI